MGRLLATLVAGPALANSLPNGEAMSFVSVVRGARSEIGQRVDAVVRTSQEWAALWARHSGRPTAPPVVDFSRDMVVAVFAGERPTSGYDVEVTRIARTDEDLRVSYRQRLPSPGVPARPVLTSPFHIVRLARSELPVRFIEESP